MATFEQTEIAVPHSLKKSRTNCFIFTFAR